MRCEEVALLVPETLDGDAPAPLSMQRHVDSCLACQAEVARYRRMLRGLHLLRTQYFEPVPGVLSQTLAAIGAASEQRAIRSLLSGKRLAYAGAIGGAAAAAGATTAAVLVARARRRATLAH